MLKSVLFVLMAAASVSATVEAKELAPWQLELQNYQSQLPHMSKLGLTVRVGFYSGTALASCSTDALVAGASFVSDTLPAFNLLSEGVANLVDPNYSSIDFESILSLRAAADISRGTLGGALVAVYESLEFVLLWLAGEEERSFEAVKKLYSSSIATTEALFARKAKCMMSFSKIALTGAELEKRQTPHQDQSFLIEYSLP